MGRGSAMKIWNCRYFELQCTRTPREQLHTQLRAGCVVVIVIREEPY